MGKWLKLWTEVWLPRGWHSLPQYKCYGIATAAHHKWCWEQLCLKVCEILTLWVIGIVDLLVFHEFRHIVLEIAFTFSFMQTHTHTHSSRAESKWAHTCLMLT